MIINVSSIESKDCNTKELTELTSASHTKNVEVQRLLDGHDTTFQGSWGRWYPLYLIEKRTCHHILSFPKYNAQVLTHEAATGYDCITIGVPCSSDLSLYFSFLESWLVLSFIKISEPLPQKSEVFYKLPKSSEVFLTLPTVFQLSS